MAKKRPISLKETKGMFKVRGIVKGMKGQNTFSSKETKSGKKFRKLNFGVETNHDSTTYLSIQGMEQDQAFFYKRPENKGEKGSVKRIPWDDRFEDQEKGYQIIGVNLGLQQDEDGKNIVSSYTQFDGSKEAFDTLEDGQGVFAKGNIEFSSFKNSKDELIRNKKFEINSIYSVKDEIDFDDDEFEEEADFKQTIIYMGIEKVEEDDEVKFLLSAKIVNYQDIQDADFYVYNKSLANTFKKSLKPYTAIEVWGDIHNRVEKEEEVTEDVWGEENKFDRVNNTYFRELRITGANKESINTEDYTEESFEEAVEALAKIGEVKKGKSDGKKTESKPSKEDDGDAWGEADNGGDDAGDDVPW